ncbi:hypothetical protein [Mucilaginibacter polytrichastri]|uniref:YD repeat-containing protein n=1 Tax=Mucilaginibacter polytrichastri TaxID=1302689 RepID=A0A1Q6A6E7_9SPHI|nr:hypothetical protein [Mucilaginibacter polytrichastri]OKS89569.1 hypothetical protein RG47T_5053 [Mucilaginibacter polytrichastri]SFS70022.1 hypothetical protein SAMN04487890_10345 [Mucilaginibacter polytrichastri]
MKTLYSIIILFLATATCTAQNVKSDLEKENLKGNVLSVTTTQQDTGTTKIINKEIATYNKDGNLISKIRYDSLFKGDTSSYRIDYEYRSHKLVRSVLNYSNRKLEITSTYTYHTLGNEVEERNYAFDTDSLLGSLISKYDEAGNLTKRITYDGHNHEAGQTYYKYSQGNLIREDRRSVDSTAYSITMAYDAMDNKMSETTNDAAGSKRSIIYHYFNYDKLFNWLSMDQSDKKDWITVRKIIYYE